MRVTETPLAGLLLVEPKVFGDARGFFLETYQTERYAQMGIDAQFVQDNHSRSRQGVLRGLHFQRTHPQGKLVSVVRGEVFDVAVDLRPGSATFGRWHAERLSDENHRQLYLPPGFAHGFCVLSAEADFVYRCTDFYDPNDEGGIRWDDPALGIPWPVVTPTVSDKDARLPPLAALATAELPQVEGRR